jgi:NAD(P)H dehydrogenase (quinone)
VPEDVARKAGMKLDQPAPVATIDELAEYDAIILGIPTRFGRMVSQIDNFLDQAGSLWARGALTGKVGSVMSSTATQHGGQETTLDEISGGAPYGATTITGSKGQRQPSQNELDAARYQGRRVADVAARLGAK